MHEFDTLIFAREPKRPRSQCFDFARYLADYSNPAAMKPIAHAHVPRGPTSWMESP
ncbi:hypothetical protein AWB78_04436 [Caballeronia calidae]|uniref:Uncharacterized protein n=1 Tax=Caballeronia calidae TaxID=1777139 RepID=A0A158CVN9_9BURK|nr:hypothetical protein AWB78_04436 [Caballeronia calidae]